MICSRECNGSAALCDRPFDQITFAGAHNAQGSATNPNWLFPNQDQNVAALLRRLKVYRKRAAAHGFTLDSPAPTAKDARTP